MSSIKELVQHGIPTQLYPSRYLYGKIIKKIGSDMWMMCCIFEGNNFEVEQFKTDLNGIDKDTDFTYEYQFGARCLYYKKGLQILWICVQILYGLQKYHNYIYIVHTFVRSKLEYGIWSSIYISSTQHIEFIQTKFLKFVSFFNIQCYIFDCLEKVVSYLLDISHRQQHAGNNTNVQ